MMGDYDSVLAEFVAEILDEAGDEQHAEVALKSLPATPDEVNAVFGPELLKHCEEQVGLGVSPEELMRRWPSQAKLLYEYFRKEIRLADQQRLVKRIRTAFYEGCELELERCLEELLALAEAFYDDAVGCESGYGYKDNDGPRDKPIPPASLRSIALRSKWLM